MKPQTPESVKKHVRSLLITHPNGCLLSKFNPEFRELCGYTIPFVQFGFKTLVDFLLSLKDAVIVNPVNGGRDYLMIGIPDEKNAHVVKMVQSQKVDSKSADARLVKQKLSAKDRQVLEETRRKVARYAQAQDSKERRSQSSPPPSRRRPSEPSTIQPTKQIQPPVQAVQKLPVQAVQKPPITAQQAYHLPSSQNTPTQAGSEPSSSVINRGNQDVPRARSGSISGASREMNLMRVIQNQLSSNRIEPVDLPDDPGTLPQLRHRIRELLSDYPEGVDIRDFSDLYYDKFRYALVPQRFGADSVHVLLSRQLGNMARLIHGVRQVTVLLKDQEFPEPVNTQQSSINLKEIRRKLVELCDRHREHGLNLRKFRDVYISAYGSNEDLPYPDRDLEEFLKKFSDVIRIEPFSVRGSRGKVVYRVGYQPKWLRVEKSEPSVPETVRNNINTLLRFYRQHGIWEEKIFTLYFSLFSTELDFKACGFDTISQLTAFLVGDILSKTTDGTGRIVLHYLPDGERDPTYLPLPMENRLDRSLTLPEGVVSPMEPYKPPVLPRDLRVKSEIYLTAGEIISPSFFYFQLCDSEIRSDLDSVATELDMFYQKYDKEFAVPRNQIAVGMNMVGEWDHVWYRGRITSVVDIETVRVLYYDYGTRDTLPIDGVRYMHRKFYELPAQAFVGRLAGIEPASPDRTPITVWSEEAKKLMVHWFLNVGLFGVVVEIVPQTASMPMIIDIELYYTHNGEDFCVNDRLVKLGHARYSTIQEAPPPTPPTPIVKVLKPSALSRRADEEMYTPMPDVVPSRIGIQRPLGVKVDVGGNVGVNFSPLIMDLVHSPMVNYMTHEQLSFLMSPRFQDFGYCEQLQYIKKILDDQMKSLVVTLRQDEWEAFQRVLKDYVVGLTTVASMQESMTQQQCYSPSVNRYSSPVLPSPKYYSPQNDGLLITVPVSGDVYQQKSAPVQAAEDNSDENLLRALNNITDLSEEGPRKIEPPKIRVVNVTPEEPVHILRFEDDVYVTAACLATVIPTAVSPRALELQLKFKKSKVEPKKLQTSSEEMTEVVLALTEANVPGMYKNDTIADNVHVYLLKDIPSILTTLGVTKQDICDGFNRVLATYSFASHVWNS